MIKPQFPTDFEKKYQAHLKRLELNGMQPKRLKPILMLCGAQASISITKLTH